MRPFFAPILGIAFFVVSTAAPGLTFRKSETVLPRSKTVRIQSPNGSWTLIASLFSAVHANTLTLEEHTTHRDKIVKLYDRSIGVGWSPDSQAFFLNDAYGSDREGAYIYRLGEDQPFPLDNLILKFDSDARRISADHTYFRVRRWFNASTILVEYCGHGSDPPAQQFDFLYRISLSGTDSRPTVVERLSHRVGSPDLFGEECMP